MPLRLPAYQPIPAPDRGTDLIEVSAAQLQPTQWCVGLAEIWSREKDFAQDTRQQRATKKNQNMNKRAHIMTT